MIDAMTYPITAAVVFKSSAIRGIAGINVPETKTKLIVVTIPFSSILYILVIVTYGELSPPSIPVLRRNSFAKN